MSDFTALTTTLKTCKVNGITVRYSDTGPRDGPLVFFLHGWPESWYSWRHQLLAMATEGYRVVAPDMRGYGGTSSPSDFHEYNVHRLAGDAIGLINHLGYEACFLVGHDWGAWLSWQLALLHRDVFVAVAVLSVPHGARGPSGMLTLQKRAFGDPFDAEEKEDCRFFYQLHHNLQGAHAHYDVNLREALWRIYGNLTSGFTATASDDSDDPAVAKPEVTSPLMYVDGVAEPLWRRLGRPRELPGWLTEGDLAYYVNEFEEHGGFEGPLCWYQTADLNWELTKPLEGEKIQQPCIFLGGENDPVVAWYGGPDGVKKKMPRLFAQEVEIKMYPGVGHWIQQEIADEVNTELIRFFGSKSRAVVLPTRMAAAKL